MARERLSDGRVWVAAVPDQRRDLTAARSVRRHPSASVPGSPWCDHRPTAGLCQTGRGRGSRPFGPVSHPELAQRYASTVFPAVRLLQPFEQLSPGAGARFFGSGCRGSFTHTTAKYRTPLRAKLLPVWCCCYRRRAIVGSPLQGLRYAGSASPPFKPVVAIPRVYPDLVCRHYSGEFIATLPGLEQSALASSCRGPAMRIDMHPTNGRVNG